VRDMRHRGRDLTGILNQYLKFVKPSFEEYILPTKKYADIIIPRGADNVVAVNLIVRHVETMLSDIKLAKRNRPHVDHFSFATDDLLEF